LVKTNGKKKVIEFAFHLILTFFCLFFSQIIKTQVENCYRALNFFSSVIGISKLVAYKG